MGLVTSDSIFKSWYYEMVHEEASFHKSTEDMALGTRKASAPDYLDSSRDGNYAIN